VVNWTDPTRPLPASPKRKYNGAAGRFDGELFLSFLLCSPLSFFLPFRRVTSLESSYRISSLAHIESAPPKPPKPTHIIPPPPRQSTFLSSVASQATNATASSSLPQVQRTSNFTAAPAAAPTRKGKEREREVDVEWEEKGALGGGGGKREEDGTVAEKLEMGPKEFGVGPGGDREWKTVEPNSGIRLK